MYGIKGVITRTNVHLNRIKPKLTIKINTKKMEEFIKAKELQEEQLLSFENRLREQGANVVKILEDERQRTEENYKTLVSLTSLGIKSRDAKRFAKRLDYFDKAIERIKKGIEIGVLGGAISINEDEAEIIVQL